MNYRLFVVVALAVLAVSLVVDWLVMQWLALSPWYIWPAFGPFLLVCWRLPAHIPDDLPPAPGESDNSEGEREVL